MVRDVTTIVDCGQLYVVETRRMKRKLLSTYEAAAAAGVRRPTLQFWIKTRKISAPRVRLVGGKAVRFWTPAQVEQIRKLKGTFRFGPKPPRKKAAAHSGGRR
jgi:hypothetical protein